MLLLLSLRSSRRFAPPVLRSSRRFTPPVLRSLLPLTFFPPPGESKSSTNTASSTLMERISLALWDGTIAVVSCIIFFPSGMSSLWRLRISSMSELNTAGSWGEADKEGKEVGEEAEVISSKMLAVFRSLMICLRRSCWARSEVTRKGG